MKLIALSKTGKLNAGKYSAMVDDHWFDYLNQWNWTYQNGYAVRCIYHGKGAKNRIHETIWMHRVIMNMGDSELEVDHRDHDKLNNQEYNLRQATGKQNKTSRAKKKCKTTSKYIGVHFYIRKRKHIQKNGELRRYFTPQWVATGSIGGNHKIIGRFKLEKDAARARDKWSKIHYGEFANLNFKDVDAKDATMSSG